MKKPTVTIIGAGLAGLAAGYELTKTKKYDVTILEEKGYIGGRTHTVTVKNTPIDVGGFIIYPWYETFHRIAKELECTSNMIPIPKNEIFYNYLNKKKFISEKDVPISLATKGKLATGLLPGLLKNLNVAKPNISRFGTKTTREFLDELLPSHADEPFKTYFDSVCQGYCYPSIDEFQVAFLLPMWGNNLFFGDIHSSYYYKNGMTMLHETMKDAIVKNGGTIMLGTTVKGVQKNTVKTTTKTLTTDFSLITHPIDKKVPYTRFLTLTVDCKGKTLINGQETWGALFLHPDTCQQPNILSMINTSVLYGEKIKGILTLNIKLTEDENGQNYPGYEKLVEKELKKIFSDVTSCTITSSTLWNHTMPIADVNYVARIKKSQGKNGIFYAGDFLGSPSMETALATGVDAAKRIIALTP